ncbi:hypothetical protein L1887_34557 [Cichorium endivia]|nr:hypothetical protein L1887_34557 [Cichorium endivia]
MDTFFGYQTFITMNLAEQSSTIQGMSSTQTKNVPNNIPAIIDLDRKEGSFTTENNRGAEKCSAHLLVHHFLKTRLLPLFPSNRQQKPQFSFQ